MSGIRSEYRESSVVSDVPISLFAFALIFGGALPPKRAYQLTVRMPLYLVKN